VAIDANAGAEGDQAFRFIGRAQFGDRPGELRLRHGILSGDIDGDGRADFHIDVRDAAIMADDILL
jgi:hypothetical protein